MDEIAKGTPKGVAAMRAGLDRKTAQKYQAAGELPSESAMPRWWRTREDPFKEDWPELEEMLGAARGSLNEGAANFFAVPSPLLSGPILARVVVNLRSAAPRAERRP